MVNLKRERKEKKTLPTGFPLQPHSTRCRRQSTPSGARKKKQKKCESLCMDLNTTSSMWNINIALHAISLLLFRLLLPPLPAFLAILINHTLRSICIAMYTLLLCLIYRNKVFYFVRLVLEIFFFFLLVATLCT